MTQLGFGFDQMFEDARDAHLPSDIQQAIPVYREMLERHHAAMLAGDDREAMAIRKEASRLAKKLNRGEPGILAGPDAPGCVLARETAAPTGTVPLWGQEGDFTVTVGKTPVRIEMDGMFGVCASTFLAPGFSAHVVEPDKPFISETGYRSFLGHAVEIPLGMTPDQFCVAMIEAHINGECRGKLRAVTPEYRGR